jgi:hypothetical protein
MTPAEEARLLRSQGHSIRAVGKLLNVSQRQAEEFCRDVPRVVPVKAKSGSGQYAGETYATGYRWWSTKWR